MTDTTNADEPGEVVVEYSGTVNVSAEARDAMYESLCDEFGTDRISQMVQNAVDEQARQVAIQTITRLFDNRESLREQLDE